jgi:hypothetical protein
MSEIRRIEVVGSASKQWVELTIEEAPPWRLVAAFSDGETIEEQGVDLFECLRAIRRAVEAEGALLCCEGARRDVFPSGMSGQMSGGRKAYRHPSRREIVDIFDPTNCAYVCTVDEQTDSIRRLRNA